MTYSEQAADLDFGGDPCSLAVLLPLVKRSPGLPSHPSESRHVKRRIYNLLMSIPVLNYSSTLGPHLNVLEDLLDTPGAQFAIILTHIRPLTFG